LAGAPALSSARVAVGATRQAAKPHFLDEIAHYVYAGDTALHIAAAAYRPAIVRMLIAMGAEVGAKNRRGAEPLHYAVDGGPGSPAWNPSAQAETVACLIEGGADPNAVDQGGRDAAATVPCAIAAPLQCVHSSPVAPMRDAKNKSGIDVHAARDPEYRPRR
jgi:hypothetical protein